MGYSLWGHKESDTTERLHEEEAGGDIRVYDNSKEDQGEFP